MKKIICYSLEEISSVADQLIQLASRYPILALEGTLGAGKTTLAKEILRKLGVNDVITSPTFTYVNVYHVNSHAIFHFDLYRLQSVDEFIALGFDEYLHVPDAIVLIEWPEIVTSLLDDRAMHIVLDYDKDQRCMTVSAKD